MMPRFSQIITFPPPCLIWYVLLLILCIMDIKVLGLFKCNFETWQYRFQANSTCSVILVQSALGVNLLRYPHLKVQTKTAKTSALQRCSHSLMIKCLSEINVHLFTSTWLHMSLNVHYIYYSVSNLRPILNHQLT